MGWFKIQKLAIEALELSDILLTKLTLLDNKTGANHQKKLFLVYQRKWALQLSFLCKQHHPCVKEARPKTKAYHELAKK